MVRAVCGDIVVMRHRRIVEQGPAGTLLATSAEPYPAAVPQPL